MSKKRLDTEKNTALYERLSRDDEMASGDSESIIHQKQMLETYAAQHGFTNCVHYTDDGWSGGNFDRPAWKRLIADIEAGKVGCVIAKDMSRLGRDYLKVGQVMEILRQRGVRLIAINDNVDTTKGVIKIVCHAYCDILRPVVADYSFLNPSVELTVSHHISQGDAMSEDVDFLLCYGQDSQTFWEKSGQWVGQELFQEPCYLLISKRYRTYPEDCEELSFDTKV